ncbi:MAG: hypothetical protein M1814_006473 [Vezdaea aestivalis]|nr:MAG: hypothetical protein M1814_006473 [Vezdaea aestivalis]
MSTYQGGSSSQGTPTRSQANGVTKGPLDPNSQNFIPETEGSPEARAAPARQTPPAQGQRRETLAAFAAANATRQWPGYNYTPSFPAAPPGFPALVPQWAAQFRGLTYNPAMPPTQYYYGMGPPLPGLILAQPRPIPSTPPRFALLPSALFSPLPPHPSYSPPTVTTAASIAAQPDSAFEAIVHTFMPSSSSPQPPSSSCSSSSRSPSPEQALPAADDPEQPSTLGPEDLAAEDGIPPSHAIWPPMGPPTTPPIQPTARGRQFAPWGHCAVCGFVNLGEGRGCVFGCEE